MKKMIPVYILQLAMLCTVVFVSLRLLREVRAMNVEIMRIRKEQVKGSIEPLGIEGSVVRVKVVNKPEVEVNNTPLEVTISR